MTAGWTFDELLTNGWFPHWHPRDGGEQPYRLAFTWYRSEIARHTVEASGATLAEAQADAAARANAWLMEHPEFKPKRPPAAPTLNSTGGVEPSRDAEACGQT